VRTRGRAAWVATPLGKFFPEGDGGNWSGEKNLTRTTHLLPGRQLPVIPPASNYIFFYNLLSYYAAGNLQSSFISDENIFLCSNPHREGVGMSSRKVQLKKGPDKVRQGASDGRALAKSFLRGKPAHDWETILGR
jgi:hypothetical protein